MNTYTGFMKMQTRCNFVYLRVQGALFCFIYEARESVCVAEFDGLDILNFEIESN